MNTTSRKFGLRLLILLGLILLLTTAANAAIKMAYSPKWQAGNGNLPTGVGFGDITGNGYLDIVVGNGLDSYAKANYVYYNGEDGPSATQDWQSTDFSYTGNIVVADFNNDGRPDLFTANLGNSQTGFPSQQHRLYLNNNGQLNASPDWSSPAGNAFSCAAGDIDNDGDLDIAFAEGTNSASNPAWSKKMHSKIYENIGGGNFDTIPIWQSDSVYQGVDIAFGDIDNDGDLDLALSGRNVGLKVFYNNAGSIETTPSYQSDAIIGGRQIVFGDVDGDGYLDLAAAGIAGGFYVFHNLGGTLEMTPSWSCLLYGEPSCVQLADVDGDGDLDLSGGGWYSHLGVFENVNGVLDNAYTWSYTGGKMNHNLQQIAWGDYDNDSLVETTESFIGVGTTQLVYLQKRNLYSLSDVRVDGISLDLTEYCYDPVDGWVSLASPVPNGQTLEITYTYSSDLDLAATLLTGNNVYKTLTYVFENQTAMDPDDVRVLLLLGENYGANYNIDDNTPSIREQFENFGWDITVTGVYDTMNSCNVGTAYYGHGPRAVDVLFDSLTLADIVSYDAFIALPCTTGHAESITNPDILDFISASVDSGIVVAAWCRAVRLLAHADEINGLDVVGHADYQAEYEAAGATYLGNDHPPVTQGNIITSVRSRFYRTAMCDSIAAAILRNRSLVYDRQQFRDDVSGDGDGIPEGGESIDLNISVINNTRDTVYDVSITMAIDDAALGIVNGYAYIGDILPRDSADCGATPLTFSIPVDYVSRIDTFYLEIVADYGDRVDNIVFTESVGHPKVLLVDDYAGGNLFEYYTGDFDKLLIPQDIWYTYDSGSPSLTDLQAYDCVVWYTGQYRIDPLSTADIDVLEQFMDNGGKLFLTGQGIAFQLDALGPVDFLNDYLKCSYVDNSLVPLIIGDETGVLFSASDTLVITTGGGGANNQTYPDHVTPLGDGLPELTYFGTGQSAGISYSGDYSLVFLPFGFEAVSSGSTRWCNREMILPRILEFLAFQMPVSAPEAQSFALSNDDVLHVTDDTPDFSWTYTDPQSVSQTQYQLQIGTDADWSSVEIWDSGPVASGDASMTYAGPAFADGMDYYARLRVSNGQVWSSWTVTSFHTNAVPTVTEMSPCDMDEITDNPPLLSFIAPLDREGDPVQFECRLFEDELLTVQIDAVSGLTGTAGETIQWLASQTFPEEEDYYWQVRANDGFEDGDWSDAAGFMLAIAFLCGDANGDRSVNIGDAVFLIQYVFSGGPAPEPIESGDVNCDTSVNIGDAVYLINYIFKSGPNPCAGC
ncbi:MAG: FG-GAP-like repeat-containing protein [Candidatus Zixiibacteriota bacterium]